MVRLSWIAFELDSATGLPRKNIIPQKRQLDEGPKFWLDVSHYPPHSMPLLLPDGIVFTELPYCRQLGSYAFVDVTAIALTTPTAKSRVPYPRLHRPATRIILIHHKCPVITLTDGRLRQYPLSA